MVAVECFRLEDARQAHAQDYDVRGRGDLTRLVERRVVTLAQPVIVSGRVADAAGISRKRAHCIEQAVLAGRRHLGAAGSLITRMPGKFPDHRDPGVRLERQKVVVGQQHRTLSRRAARQRVMAILVDLGLPLLHVDTQQRQADYPRDGPIQHRFGQMPVANGAAHAPVVDPAAGRHLQIQPVLDPFDPIVGGTPVGDHQSFEAPLVAQHAVEQPVVFTAVLAVQSVVRTHDGPRLRPPDRNLETPQIQFA